MPRDYLNYIQDILTAIDKIKRYVHDSDYDEFRADEKLVDAVVRNLEIIGEAAKNVPLEIRNKYPGIEWKKVSGFRDLLAHSYFGVDLEIVWDIVKNKLPDLGDNTASILKKNKKN